YIDKDRLHLEPGESPDALKIELDPPEGYCCPTSRDLTDYSLLERMKREAADAKRDGPAESQVHELLEKCRQALLGCRVAEAEMFAARALAIDPMCVAADPLVYKIHLLEQFKSPAVQMHPTLPGIDPNVVRAYNEILDSTPSKLFITVREPDAAPCEEKQETTAAPVKPNVCVDCAQNKEGLVRIRCQLGSFCFRLDCNQQGHGSLILGVGSDNVDPVSQFFGTALEGVFKALDSVISPEGKGPSH